MVGSSKILTVSYGTFSCTLEGFDQPFETMKSIAEYFRDLAADDRYFGAEPPQPDVQMLHQIAEREVNRRVEARVERNGVILRQTAETAAAAPGLPAAPPRAPRDVGADRRPSTSRAEPADNAPFDVEIDGDSVAAKLSRIRAVVARARAARTADTAFVEDEPVEPYLDRAATDPFEQPEPLAEEEDDFATDAAAEDDSEPAASLGDMIAEEMIADEDALPGLEEGAPDSSVLTDQPVEDPMSTENDTGADTGADADAGVDLPRPDIADAAAATPRAAPTDDPMPLDAEDLSAEPEPLLDEPLSDTASGAVVADMLDTDDSHQAAPIETAHIETVAIETVEIETVEIETVAIETGGTEAGWVEIAEIETATVATFETDLPEIEAATAEETEVETPGIETAEIETAEDNTLSVETAATEIREDATETASPADPASDVPSLGATNETAGETPRAVPQRPHARVIKLKRTEFEAALAAGEIEEVEDDEESDETDDMIAEIEVDNDETDGDADLVGTGDTTETEEGADLDDAFLSLGLAESGADADDDLDADARARTARDAEFEIASGADSPSTNVFAVDPEEDATDTDADDSLTEGIRDLIGQTSLDPEDEDDLLAELAEVERDTVAQSDADRLRARFADFDEDDDADETAHGDTLGASGEDDAAAQEEASDERALNRLLVETNAKLSETEGSRRRSAIAHLKAAVAATKADRLLKGNRAEPQVDESLNRYRDDLAQVVRPRRPSPSRDAVTDKAPGRERPADPLAARPAPLVLVSEQRIDRPAQPATSGAVRPRRVSASRVGDAHPAPASPAISFSDFAAERGAEDLPDILEAAAAYATLVEGQSEMSRPQILRRAASLNPGTEISREKGLQSFGQLLRSGRIRKVGHGQFALSADSAEPRTRASGG